MMEDSVDCLSGQIKTDALLHKEKYCTDIGTDMISLLVLADLEK